MGAQAQTVCVNLEVSVQFQTSSSVPRASYKVVPPTRPRVKHLAVVHNSLWDHIMTQQVIRHNFFFLKKKKKIHKPIQKNLVPQINKSSTLVMTVYALDYERYRKEKVVGYVKATSN